MRLARLGLVPLLVLPVAWLLFQGLGRDPRAIPSALIDRPAPPVVALSMGGETVRLDAYRGRPVILNFWASWCFECIAEHRVLMEAQKEYGERFAIVGVLYQDTVADARGFLARYGDGGWPNLVDPDGRLAIDYGVTGVPESFFIDAAGVVRYKQYGAVTPAVLDEQLPPLLADDSRSPDPTGQP
ncbi:MAG: DsbE family thiol:disulfide interchange protein [Sporichthyaceae bacterium]